jgi:hypothetical protein
MQVSMMASGLDRKFSNIGLNFQPSNNQGSPNANGIVGCEDPRCHSFVKDNVVSLSLLPYSGFHSLMLPEHRRSRVKTGTLKSRGSALHNS